MSDKGAFESWGLEGTMNKQVAEPRRLWFLRGRLMRQSTEKWKQETLPPHSSIG
jgi:hypothetical protein